MRVVSILMGCLALGAVAAVEAQTSAVAAPAPAPTAPAAAIAPAATAAPAAAPASNAAPAAASTAAMDKKMISRGYKPEMTAGNERVYCRKEDQIGTRLAPKKVCLTAEQADLAEHDAKETTERIQRSNKPVGGT
jgi:hypothetical protein